MSAADLTSGDHVDNQKFCNERYVTLPGRGALGDVAYTGLNIEEFQRFTRSAKKKFPTAETAFQGELPYRIKEALPSAQVRTFGANGFQTVYEVIPSS